MAINPAIAMSFQAPKFEDPMNRLVQMEQMKAYQQNALAKQMEMETAKEAMAQQKGLRNYLAGLSPNQMPSLVEMAKYGDKGYTAFNAFTEAQEKQREAAANIYKEVYLPMLSGAKTAKDVYNWRQAVKSDPRVAPVVTKEADYGLPKTDEEVSSYKQQHLVPYEKILEEENKNRRAQAKIDAEARKEKGPYQIGPNLVSSTGEVIYQGTKEGANDWQEQVSPDGTLRYFSPSRNETVTSTGRPVEQQKANKPPSGYEYAEDGKTLKAIPGGPHDPDVIANKLSAKQKIEYQKSFPKVKQSFDYSISEIDKTIRTIDDLLKNEEGIDAIFGSVYQMRPSLITGSMGNRAMNDFETLMAGSFVTSIIDLRNASPTGSAVGNVTEKEGDKLQIQKAGITRKLSTNDDIKRLKRLKSDLEYGRDNIKSAFNDTYSWMNQETPASPKDEAGGKNKERRPLGDIFN
jgi:hypothetical protein